MQVITSENERAERKHLKNKVRPKNDVDQEMRECLTRLKVWQTENLMAPHGMNKFAEEKKGEPV